MPIESSWKDLQIICHFYVKLLLHGIICVTKRQPVSKCLRYSFFFLSPDQFSANDWDMVTEKLAIRFQ